MSSIKDTCIIFSSYVPKDKLDISLFYLNLFKENFKDADVFVGVNNKNFEWLNALEESKKELNLQYKLVSDEYHVDSDVSGYQAGLSLYKNSGLKHKTVLFIHTKNITYKYPDINRVLNGVKNTFLTKEVRKKVDEIFTLNSQVGLWSSWCCKTTDSQKIESLNNFYKFHHSGTKLFVCDSIYYMRGYLIYDFIHNCLNDFFTSKITSMSYNGIQFDRYFMERDFPSLCWLMGYEFDIDNIQPHPNNFTKDEYDEEIYTWRVENFK